MHLLNVNNVTITGYDIRTSLSLAEFETPPNMFECGSGEFILNTFICDGLLDCMSGDDESGCRKLSINVICFLETI